MQQSFQAYFAIELAAIVLLIPIAFWANYFVLCQYFFIDELGGPQAELSWGMITGMLASQWPLVIAL